MRPSLGSACVSYLVVTLAFHLPRLTRPLADIDACAGAFFGVFFQYYERDGFGPLRGMPLWRQLFETPTMAEPYLTHPPGLWWAMYALGGSEWAMRVPTVVAAFAASVALFVLLRPRIGEWAAWLAGQLLLAVPVMAVYCQLSYEPVSVAFGLWMFVATERVRAAAEGGVPWRWVWVQAGCAFVGTWMDWSFGMFCFGLAALAYDRRIKLWALQLLAPGVAAILAVVTVLVWQSWALGSPLVTPPPPELGSLEATLERTIGARPSIGDSFYKGVHWLNHCAGLAVLLATLAGMWTLARRAGRLAAGLAIAGAAHFLLFAGHALVHPHFYCVSMPFAVAATASLGTFAIGRARIPVVALLTVITAATWWHTIQLDQRTDSTFMRDLGATFDRAAVPLEGTTTPLHVATNFLPIYASYVTAPTAYVAGPIVTPASLENVRKDRPFRYVWLQVETAPGAIGTFPNPELDAWLAPFPKTRVPELEHHLYDPGYLWDTRIRAAWIVHIPKAQ